VNQFTTKLLLKNLSLVVLFPNSKQERTLEVYYIKNGVYISSHIVGTRADLNLIFTSIEDIFIKNNSELEVLEIDELKILNN